jgi:hypothetical protein
VQPGVEERRRGADGAAVEEGELKSLSNPWQAKGSGRKTTTMMMMMILLRISFSIKVLLHMA